jgi:hypothetical protein
MLRQTLFIRDKPYARLSTPAPLLLRSSLVSHNAATHASARPKSIAHCPLSAHRHACVRSAGARSIPSPPLPPRIRTRGLFASGVSVRSTWARHSRPGGQEAVRKQAVPPEKPKKQKDQGRAGRERAKRLQSGGSCVRRSTRPEARSLATRAHSGREWPEAAALESQTSSHRASAPGSTSCVARAV